MQAIEVLIEHGVAAERILFLNLVASPEGLKNVYERFPKVRVVSAWVDEGLSEKNYSEYSNHPVGVSYALGQVQRISKTILQC